jgi:phosphopantetheinyl transferase
LAAQLWSGREALGKAEGSGMLPVLSLPLNLEDSQHRYQLSGADYWLQWLTGPPDYALAVAGIGVRPARIEYTDQTGTFSAALANEQR